MGGLYLRSTFGAPDFDTRSARQAAGRLVSLENDRVACFSAGHYAGCVVHHGRLRSCGISESARDRYLLALYGACWLNDEAAGLASPDEVLGLWADEGLGHRASVRGNFNLACIDLKREELVVETDLFGVHPLYYLLDSAGDLHLCSEIKGLSGIAQKKLCLPAVAEILKYGYLVTNLTLIEGVFRLMPNSRLTFSKGKLEVRDYPFPAISRQQKADDAVLAELDQAFLRNIARYRPPSNTLSVSMSGGLDSRIAAFAARSLDYALVSWSSGVKGALECKIAEKVSRQIGAPFFHQVQEGEGFSRWFDEALWITEGRCHPGHMHFLGGALAGSYRPELQLHGLIGDAVIGGDFDQGWGLAGAGASRARCQETMQSFVYWPAGCLENLLQREIAVEVERVEERVAEFLFSRIGFSGSYSDYLWFRYNFRVFGFTIPCLGSQITPWCDPVFPYLDNAFFETAGRVGLEDIVNRQTQIRWAKKCYPDVAEVPRVKDGVLVRIDDRNVTEYDRKIRRLEFKNKMKYYLCRASGGRINLDSTETYPYYDQWYRKFKGNRHYVDALLQTGEMATAGLWNPGATGELLADLGKGRNVWNAVGSLLLVELFARQFIQGSAGCGNVLKRSVYGDGI